MSETTSRLEAFGQAARDLDRDEGGERFEQRPGRPARHQPAETPE